MNISTTDNKQKYSTPIGIIVIAIWGCILVGMMLHKINEFTNQYTNNETCKNTNNDICYK